MYIRWGVPYVHKVGGGTLCTQGRGVPYVHRISKVGYLYTLGGSFRGLLIDT